MTSMFLEKMEPSSYSPKDAYFDGYYLKDHPVTFCHIFY